MRLEKYFFALTIFAALLLTFFLLKPFANYLVLAAILTYFLRPLQRRLLPVVRSPALCAILLIILVIVLVVVPTFYLTSHLITQVTAAYNNFKEANTLERFTAFVQMKTGSAIHLESVLLKLLDNVREFLVGAAPNFLGSLASLVIGLFIIFFVMYYTLQMSGDVGHHLARLIPLEADLKEKMLEEVQAVLEGVLYGQFVTALIHGAAMGVGFAIFGIQNALFWAVLMTILSFVPVLGTPIIWVPAAVSLMMEGHVWLGLGLLVYSSVIVAVIDNVLKPRLISDKSNIHPVVVMIGVLGGLKLFGFIGLVIGPLVLALLMRLLVFYEEVYLPKQA